MSLALPFHRYNSRIVQWADRLWFSFSLLVALCVAVMAATVYVRTHYSPADPQLIQWASIGFTLVAGGILALAAWWVVWFMVGYACLAKYQPLEVRQAKRQWFFVGDVYRRMGYSHKRVMTAMHKDIAKLSTQSAALFLEMDYFLQSGDGPYRFQHRDKDYIISRMKALGLHSQLEEEFGDGAWDKREARLDKACNRLHRLRQLRAGQAHA